jgi:hypothetical protein
VHTSVHINSLHWSWLPTSCGSFSREQLAPGFMGVPAHIDPTMGAEAVEGVHVRWCVRVSVGMGCGRHDRAKKVSGVYDRRRERCQKRTIYKEYNGRVLRICQRVPGWWGRDEYKLYVAKWMI